MELRDNLRRVDLNDYINAYITRDNNPTLILDVPYNLRVVVRGDSIHEAAGNLIQDIPRTGDPRRPGYNYAIWSNCPKDENGYPRQVEPILDTHGHHIATWIGYHHDDGTPDTGPIPPNATLMRNFISGQVCTIPDHDHLKIKALEERVAELERRLVFHELVG